MTLDDLGRTTGISRISPFSGSVAVGKGEVNFDQWLWELEGFQRNYPEGIVRQATVKSLTGDAVNIAH